ncbi:MAG: hypothetical protein NTW19_11075 [Planctomycetota bacterium]|nr:hypothetical protein [Planctomycetota bacterium]
MPPAASSAGPSAPPSSAAMGNRLEPLEPRVLLTTLVGGDVYEFVDANNQTVRVRIEGDAIVELIGASVDDQNQAVLGDLPGRFVGSTIGRTGTTVLGGGSGIQDIGPTPISDPINASNSITRVPGDNINLNAIASRDENGGGATYAFNVGSVTVGTGSVRNVLELVRFDSLSNTSSSSGGAATVKALIQQASLRDDILSTLTSTMGTVSSFAIDPTSGDAFAVNSERKLFRVNRVTGNVTPLGPISNVSSTLSVSEVSGAGTYSGDLVGYTIGPDGISYSLFNDPQLNNALFKSTTSTSPATAAVNGDLGAAYNIIALAVGKTTNDPTYAVNKNGANYEIYQIVFDSAGHVAGATRKGILHDSANAPITDVQSLAFDSTGLLYTVGQRPGASGGRTVYTIDPNTALVTAVNLIAFNNTILSNSVDGLAFGADGVLYGVANVGGQDLLIRIDTTNTPGPGSSSQISAPGSVSSFLSGLTSDAQGIFYSVFQNGTFNAALFKSLYDQVPHTAVESDLSGGGSLLANYNFQSIAEAPGGAIYAINLNGSASELYKIERDATTGGISAVAKVGTITNATGGAITAPSGGYVSITADPIAGDLFIVGLDATQPNPTRERLYRVSTTRADTNGNAADGGEVVATLAGVLTNNGAPVTGAVRGLTFSSIAGAIDTRSLLAVVRDTAACECGVLRAQPDREIEGPRPESQHAQTRALHLSDLLRRGQCQPRGLGLRGRRRLLQRLR